MRLEDLKNDIPETPEFIHQMICKEVDKQIQSSNMVELPKKKKIRWNYARVAAVACACLVGTSTAVYAGNQLYQMYLEKQGTYQVGIGIHSQEELKVPEQIHDVIYSVGYVPDGMEVVGDSSKVRLYAKDRPHQGGISISSVLMDSNNLDAVLKETGVIDSESFTFGSHEGVYVQYQDFEKDYSFNQRIYMLCPEVYQVLTIYVGDDVSKEDAIKFAETLQIQETDTMIDTTGLYTWSDMVNSEIIETDQFLTEAVLPIHQIGETFAIGASYEDEEGKYLYVDSSENEVCVSVDSVKIEDNLDLLSGKDIPSEWKIATDENGKLVDNHISYVKRGDGVETLDQVVREEDVPQKLVHTTVTYTNMADKEMKHLLYLGTMMTLKQNGNTFTAYDVENMSGENYDMYYGSSVARPYGMTYYSVCEDYGNGGNYISSLKPGESVQIEMAWIVNETDLDHLYLNLSGTGASCEFDEALLNAGVVKIVK